MIKMDEASLSILYAVIEIKRNDNSKNNPLFKYENKDLYSAINIIYFKETGEKFDIIDSDVEEKLYQWAKKKSRYELLNYLIEKEIKRFSEKEQILDETVDNTDLFIANNINSLINIMLYYFELSVSSLSDRKVMIPKINRCEYEKIVVDIISEIDPTLEWLELYKKAKEMKRIIYLNDCTIDEKVELSKRFGKEILTIKNLCIYDNNGPYLILTLDGNLRDILITLHEFAHYIIRFKYHDVRIQPTLAEFFSIFFELYGLEFLRKKDYDDKEIFATNFARLENTISIAVSSATLLEYIEIFINQSVVTEDEDIKRIHNSRENFLKMVDEDFVKYIYKKDPDYFDYEKAANKECDECIKELITNPCKIFSVYPYVIGNYLAINAIENLCNDTEILVKIKKYLNCVLDVDPYDVFEGVGCDILGLDLKKGLSEQKKKLAEDEINLLVKKTD